MSQHVTKKIKHDDGPEVEAHPQNGTHNGKTSVGKQSASQSKTQFHNVNREHLKKLLDRERTYYKLRNPKSLDKYKKANNLFAKVPNTWMNKFVGGFPMYINQAFGNKISTLDNHTYIDFALGDTGAMAGHSPTPTTQAVIQRLCVQGGATTMLPTEDAQWVGQELAKRYKLPLWSFTLTATDANRWAIRIARMVTGKSKVINFSYCYHGSVDETFAVRNEDGTTKVRSGNVGPPVDLCLTTRPCEFNDLKQVEDALKHGDVALIMTEPALTNIGIILPDQGFLKGLRDLADKYKCLLLFDETHTQSACVGGATQLWDLHPDIITIGKCIGGGIPCGAYGVSQNLAEQVKKFADADLCDVGGVGGTLAGNQLSLAAMRATLEHVLNEKNYEHMIQLATKFTQGVQEALKRTKLPWCISQLGGRAEYRFTAVQPKNGTESMNAHDNDLDEYMHLYMINRGILMTPFHNMALMCPYTEFSDIDYHTKIFNQAADDLVNDQIVVNEKQILEQPNVVSFDKVKPQIDLSQFDFFSQQKC